MSTNQKVPPKYMRCIADGPIPSAGDYIVRSHFPKCVGIVVVNPHGIRVLMSVVWDEMPLEKQKAILTEMEKWYYNKYVKAKTHEGPSPERT